MHKIIISDTSCLIVLSNIGELELLKKVYGNTFTTTDVAEEFGEDLPSWIEIRQVKDFDKQRLLEIHLDKGESSAMALALETENSTVILDDYKARQIADKLGIIYTGTIGVIVKAKIKGIIPAVRPILEKMKEVNFHISPELEKMVLLQADE